MTLSDWIGVTGLVVTAGGFILTLIQLGRTKSAAESAQEAANDIRNRLRQVNTIADLASALSVLDEIRRLHRAEAWEVLPERYSTLRRMLVTIRSANPAFDESDQETLQNAITHLATFEARVDRALTGKSNGNAGRNPNFSRLLLEQSDRLHDLLTRLKQTVGD